MTSQEFRQIFKEEAGNILRLYAAFFTAPFFISKEFITRPTGEPFRWPPESVRATRNVEDRAERAS